MAEKIKSKYFPSGIKPDGRPVTNSDEDLKLNPKHPEWYYEKYGSGKYGAKKVKENKNSVKK